MKPKTERHIPSRFIYYFFVCRNCGQSDEGEFDKFKEPKKSYLLCSDCEREIQLHNIDDFDDLPF